MINTQIISLKYILQIRIFNDIPHSRRSRFNNLLCINTRSKLSQSLTKTITKDELSESQEETTAELLRECDDGHTDGDLSGWKDVLTCDDRHLDTGSATETNEDLVSDPF